MADPHVVTALRAKRAELAGEIQAAEKRVAQLRADLVHLDATLRLFDPKADPEAIPVRRPYRRRRWFSDGELPRRILATLRTSPAPLSASALAEMIVAQKRWYLIVSSGGYSTSIWVSPTRARTFRREKFVDQRCHVASKLLGHAETAAVQQPAFDARQAGERCHLGP
jgi:hypothetical protein